MRARFLFCAAALALSASCAEPDTGSAVDPATREDPEEIGTVSLKLVGSDTSGRTYRLRNAEFQIMSNPWMFPPPFPGLFPGEDGGTGSVTTLSTETDPDALLLTARVVPGVYSVALTSDWYLERDEGNGDGFQPVEQVVLLSESYQYVYVYDQATSYVDFRFGVDGELIDFRSGEVQIGISIEQPGEKIKAVSKLYTILAVNITINIVSLL